MNRYELLWALAGLALLMPYQLFAMPQRMGDFELALDAPRRLEPFSTSDPRYGDIPIQITINDAYLPNDVATRFLQRLVEIEQTGVYREKNSPFTLLPQEWDSISNVIQKDWDEALGGIENLTVGRFHSLMVHEESQPGVFDLVSTFNLTGLHEIERTDGPWRMVGEK